MKYFKKKKIKKYLENLKNNDFPEDYLKSHEKEIGILEWLVSYYEGKTVSTPKELLQICLYHERPEDIKIIKLLYFWIYEKHIVGF